MCLSSCFQKYPILLRYPIIIDCNNVAYNQFEKNKKPKLSNITLLSNYLVEELGFQKEKIYCICDPSLKHYIDCPDNFNTLIKEGLIFEAPKVADEMILGFALKHHFCFIISNDKFREYTNQLPSKNWIEERRVSFMFMREEICLSPSIDYDGIALLPLKEEKTDLKDKKTTLEVLNQIEKTKGVLDLF